jgi:hypothetical protein
MKFFHTSRPVALSLLLAALTCGGCFYGSRPAKTQEALLQSRADADQQARAMATTLVQRLIDRTKAQYDDYMAGRRPDPPVVDILVISGGGDWGAFGAGVLKGWGTLPAGSAMSRPDFAVVTGVSTGALIAPFAFLDSDASIDQVENVYRNPNSDWVKSRGWLYFLPSNISFAEIPGLEKELRSQISGEMISDIARRGSDGRILAVNTTNVDDGAPRVFDLVAEAVRANKTGDTDRFHTIILASAGIPGAFPFRMIDNEMYVDGGVTGNIIYGGRLGEEQTFQAIWQRQYPNLTIPKVRFWVIYNNQIHCPPQVTAPKWPSVVARSVSVSIAASTLESIRHLYATADISRLKRHCDVEVRVIAIPDNWTPPVDGAFAKPTMNSLADIGEKMGADPASWNDKPPAP